MKKFLSTVLLLLLAFAVALPVEAQRKKKRKDRRWVPFAATTSQDGVWDGVIVGELETRDIEGDCIKTQRLSSVAIGLACATDDKDRFILREASALISGGMSPFPVKIKFNFKPHGFGDQDAALGVDVQAQLLEFAEQLEAAFMERSSPPRVVGTENVGQDISTAIQHLDALVAATQTGQRDVHNSAFYANQARAALMDASSDLNGVSVVQTMDARQAAVRGMVAKLQELAETAKPPAVLLITPGTLSYVQNDN